MDSSRTRRFGARLLGALVLGCVMAGAGVTAAFGYGWAEVSTPATQALSGVSFTSATNGWIVGDNAAVFHTTNGGSTWTTVTVPTTANLAGVRFVDAQHGWVTGDNATILHTSNGGAGWEVQSTGYSASLAGPAVIDSQTAWVAMPGAGGAVLRTTSGGYIWSGVMNGSGESMFDVSFSDALHGYAVGSGGVVYRTIDGGQTWTPKSPVGYTHWLQAVSAFDANTVLAVSSWGEILYSEDAGDSWDITTTPAGSLWAAQWRPRDGHAWVAGYNSVFFTNDWASTWHQTTTPAGNVKDLAFPDDSVGYAVCDDGTFLKYTPPAAPVAHSIQATGTSTVWVTWDASPDAVSYQVRQGASTQSGILGTTTSMGSQPQGVSAYKVRCLTADGLYSDWSVGTVTIRGPQTLVLYRTPFALTYPTSSITVSGNTGGHEATVAVEVKPAGGVWKSTGVVLHSGPTGVLPSRTIPVRSNASVRLTSKITSYWLAGVSNAATVTYRPLVKTPTQAKAYVGRRLTTSVRVYTPLANPKAILVVRYYRRVNGAWRRVTTLTASSGSWSAGSTRYTRRYTPKRRGTWKIVASYAGGTLYSGGSSSKSFTVY